VSAVVVLMYHRIGGGRLPGREQGEESYCVHPDAFEAQLDAFGSRPHLPAEELVTSALSGRVPAGRSFALSFDDGNASDHAHALPALQRRGLRGAFFVTPAWTGSPGYMDRSQLRELVAAGMSVGAHGLDHTPLASLSGPRLRAHLEEARGLLEDAIGRRVRTLSLPGGSGGREVLVAARDAGFELVLDSTPRRFRGGGGPVPRFAVRRSDSLEDVRGLVEQRPDVLLGAWLRHLGLQALRRLLGGGLYAWLRGARLGGASTP
jgi:peptidoglycan/xylan/chitin deacetylase (PgdA/CDA1 family)